MEVPKRSTVEQMLDDKFRRREEGRLISSEELILAGVRKQVGEFLQGGTTTGVGTKA